ncbi:MAG: response regulator [Lachnospiraceae bacterium]|nr:response regulator [Lachnospiraceae bacterium]
MKNTATRQFLLSILLIFVLQAFVLAFIFRSFHRSSKKDILDMGESNLKSQAAMVENYLARGGNVLWFAAGSVDHMLRHGADSEELLHYLLEQTQKMQEQFDENFTGIYGYLNGDYVDGAGWTPPADYSPTERSWYLEAIEARGEMVLSAPYVDAQTGEIVVSFSQMLSDGRSVLSVDIVLNEVQTITEEMTMGGMGYGFIADSEGLVISHSDRNRIGSELSGSPEWDELLSRIEEGEEDGFEMNVRGERCTVFTESIATDWHVVIVANNALLYQRLCMQILVGILMSVLIDLIIVVFSVGSTRRISRAEQREQESLARLQQMNMNIIRSLASTIDAKDRYTSGHSRRVAEYAVMLAKKLGKSEEEQRIIYYAGLLHDVGKIRVPEEVIDKPGRLTEEEFDQIRIHPVSGFHILSDIHDDARIGYGAKYHHERFDGKGYPNGLMGEDIPEISRIIAVADAYDAMASDRSYRKALPQKVVRSEIEKNRGTQFDPEIADKMLEIIDEDTDYELRQREEKEHSILVVDDEPMIIRDVRRILQEMEHIRVYDASNSRDALFVLEKTDISLILLDLRMPDTDGFTLYRHIREKYRTPVILMTSEKSLETIEQIRKLGIDDYLTKPLNEAITREAVHGIIKRHDSEL